MGFRVRLLQVVRLEVASRQVVQIVAFAVDHLKVGIEGEESQLLAIFVESDPNFIRRDASLEAMRLTILVAALVDAFVGPDLPDDAVRLARQGVAHPTDHNAVLLPTLEY